MAAPIPGSRCSRLRFGRFSATRLPPADRRCRDYAGADGARGNFQDRFDAYEREGEPCRRAACRGRIRRIVQAGRSTFFCPVCQR